MRKKRDITLRDIADLAKVSPTTVSMILNGKAQENHIPNSTCEKIMQIVREKIMFTISTPVPSAEEDPTLWEWYCGTISVTPSGRKYSLALKKSPRFNRTAFHFEFFQQ